MSALIDVWDTETFDQGLISELRASEQLVRDYPTTDRRQFEEREASDRWMPYASNKRACSKIGTFLNDEVGSAVLPVTLRRWRCRDESHSIKKGFIFDPAFRYTEI